MFMIETLVLVFDKDNDDDNDDDYDVNSFVAWLTGKIIGALFTSGKNEQEFQPS